MADSLRAGTVIYIVCTTSLLGSSVGKESTAMQETPVRFLGREDTLEKGEATHSSILGLPWWLSW